MVQRWDFRETEKRELEAEAKRKAGVTSCLSSKNRVAIVRGIIWNTNFFCQVKEKSGNSMVGQVNLGRTRKVREIETNWLRQSSENVLILFMQKGCTSWKDSVGTAPS